MDSKAKINEVVRVHELTYVITEIKRIGMPIFAIVEIRGQKDAKIIRTFVSHEMAATALMQIQREAEELFRGIL